MEHAVPLVFGANFLLKSTNISLCAMSRLDLVTFGFSVGCRCAIGIVTKWCDFPPCDVTFLHLAFPLGDVTFLRLMWLKPGACSCSYWPFLLFSFFFQPGFQAVNGNSLTSLHQKVGAQMVKDAIKDWGQWGRLKDSQSSHQFWGRFGGQHKHQI